MINFEYQNPTRIIFGQGAEAIRKLFDDLGLAVLYRTKAA